MKLIIGLGNPGREYLFSRHNVGFMVVDHFLVKHPPLSQKNAHRGVLYRGRYAGEDFLLFQPHTYMNLSGEAVQSVIRYYRIDPQDILVIYDDMDLPLGKLRLRTKGGAGGHNGMKNIIQHLGTQDFKRMRIGIGRSAYPDSRDYVLGSFQESEREVIKPLLEEAHNALLEFLTLPFNLVMSHFNRNGSDAE
jgi:PTH1 family peptidyl-tRNA hydrolase